MDWGLLVMKFRARGTTITLYGDPSLNKTLVTLKLIMRVFRENGEGVLLELGSLTTQEEDAGWVVPDSLQELLVEFKHVFEEPCGLPPHRRRDHVITLQPGVSPMNVCPYWYPYLQKNEIERLV